MPKNRKKARTKLPPRDPALGGPRDLNTGPPRALPPVPPAPAPAPANPGIPPRRRVLGGPRNLDTRGVALPAPPGPGMGVPPRDPVLGGPRNLNTRPAPPPRLKAPAAPDAQDELQAVVRPRLVRSPQLRQPAGPARAFNRPRNLDTRPVPAGPPQIPAPTADEITAAQLRREQQRREQERVEQERIETRNRLAETTLRSIYGLFYDEDGTRQGTRYLPGLYSSLTGGGTAYTDTPIDFATFDEFMDAALKTGVVTSQLVFEAQAERAEYERRVKLFESLLDRFILDEELDLDEIAFLRSGLPTLPASSATTLEDALSIGDYFHVHNRFFTHRAEMASDQRRLIVNVTDQHAALAVADALSLLYGQADVSPWLYEHKIFLATGTEIEEDIKFDKIVVYYVPQPREDGEDVIGGLLVSTISAAIPPGAAVDEFGPFYSRLAPGIAWAEEPTAFIQAFAGLSFSQTRIQAVTSVIEANDHIESPEDFLTLVYATLQSKGIDPTAPHRHLGSPPTSSPRPSHS